MTRGTLRVKCFTQVHNNVPSRAATIHGCTGEPRYFLPQYEYRYLNGISLYRKTTKHFSSKIKNYFTNIQKLLLQSVLWLLTQVQAFFLATGLRYCLVSLRVLPITYFSWWQRESMCSFNKLSADTVLCTRSKHTRFTFQFWFQLFLCYFLPFVNYYQWKFKIPKQFSNITSLVSCMLWCMVSWHLYWDMYWFLRKCIVAALVPSQGSNLDH